jgi:hypothetical protein
MDNPRKPHPVLSLLSLLPLLVLAACVSNPGEGQQSARETDRTREAERRVCQMQPPGEIERCLRRVEEEYVARQGMRQVERRTEPARSEAPIEEVPPAR